MTPDSWLLERLVCPATRAPLRWDEAAGELVSEAAGLAYPVRDGVPVLLTEAINLFKSTALVYVVGVRDFLTAAGIIGTRDNNLVDVYLLVAIVYLALCLAASRAVGRLRRGYAL